ncbi:unnamed protein product [Camellia sinensis]
MSYYNQQQQPPIRVPPPQVTLVKVKQRTLICHRATRHNKPTPLQLRATLLKGTLLNSSTPSPLPTNSPAVVPPKVALKDGSVFDHEAKMDEAQCMNG